MATAMATAMASAMATANSISSGSMVFKVLFNHYFTFVLCHVCHDTTAYCWLLNNCLMPSLLLADWLFNCQCALTAASWLLDVALCSIAGGWSCALSLGVKDCQFRHNTTSPITSFSI
jgi:hypothetical protein